MERLRYNDEKIARALDRTIGRSRWEAVALSHAYLMLHGGESEEDAAKTIYSSGAYTLGKSKEIVQTLLKVGFISMLKPRERTGSAENPITKLFPATVTEERFVELLESLCSSRKGVSYTDDRDSRGLTDFTLIEGDKELPINVKNAGTRFEKAKELVGINPDDCVPIPAYKANNALDNEPNLIYVISVDYNLIEELGGLLPGLFNEDESLVWDLLNRYAGSRIRDGEDWFVFSMVKKYWDSIRPVVADNPYSVISARKAIRILQTHPRRTPGIGLRAWGTGASAEVNVHICVSEETIPWEIISERIAQGGIEDILSSINKKSMEEVYDPEV